MRKQCLGLRKFKCRGKAAMTVICTMVVSCAVYILSFVVLAQETDSNPSLWVHDSQQLENPSIDMGINKVSGNSVSLKMQNAIRRTSGADDSIYLEEEDMEVLNKDLRAKAQMSHFDNKNATKCLPQAIIIGVKKAGTRALLEYLRLHPKVRAPGPEPHFFDKNFDKGLKWYRKLMPETRKGQLTIEKTPSYFVTKGVPEKVYRMSKSTKLIVVFRDPVTRAVSDYAQLLSRNPSVQSFEEMVYVDNRTKIINTSWTIVKIGIYAQHLVKWLEYFPIEQFHFVSGENLIKDPGNELIKIQQFLGIEPHITLDNFTFNQTKGFPCYRKHRENSKWHCLNEEKGRRHPVISSSVRRNLEDFYKPFNMKLYSMTGQTFGWS